MVSLGALGLDAGIFAIDEPIAVLSDCDDGGVAVGTRLTLDALDALFALGALGTLFTLRTLGSVLAVLTVLTVGDGENGRMAVGIGDCICVN